MRAWYYLNPYFPGFIFLIQRGKRGFDMLEFYLNPYFPGFIFLIARLKERYRPSTKLSQSLFSWIHLSYANMLEFIRLFIDSSLNPYFPGFIFLILQQQFLKLAGNKPSQSLFSWIHLSYPVKVRERSFFSCVSILIFLDSSFLWMGKIDPERAMFEVSILIFLDSSFLSEESAEVAYQVMGASQSLFSWIHLSY